MEGWEEKEREDFNLEKVSFPNVLFLTSSKKFSPIS